MKNSRITILLFMLVSIKIFGINADEKPVIDTLRNAYLGIGTGNNNYNGVLGINIKIRLVKTLYIRGGAGMCAWGYKISAGIHYDLKPLSSWGFCASYSYNTGVPSFQSKLETVQGKNVAFKDVTLEYLQTSTMNLTATKHWTIRKKNNIYLDLGFAIPIDSNSYKIKDGSELTSTSKAVLNLMHPGGIIIGLGFMFGL